MTVLSKMMFAQAVVAFSLCAACSPSVDDDGDVDAEEEDVQESEAAVLVSNGVQMNGVQMNGVQMNGVQMNGVQMNGVQMNGVQMNGTSLSGTLIGGLVLNGLDFIGATMVAVLSNGATVPLKIDDIKAAPADPDIKLYTISYLNGGTWSPVCGSNAAGPIPGIPLKGRWDNSGAYVADPSMLTLACRGAALAKCVELGYKPWVSVQECKDPMNCKMVSLASVHQACTRMVRADYCGDGVAHTHDGTLINVWDGLGVQAEEHTGIYRWKQEAEWGTSGMVCEKNLREDANDVTTDYIDAHCPAKRNAVGFKCFDSKSTFFTKNGFMTPLASRSLLRNSFDLDGYSIWAN